MNEKQNILLIGSGGREHAIALKIAESDKLNNFYAIPGNPGISKVAICNTDIDIMDNDAVTKFAQENNIDLVIVGPENPLANGVVDELSRVGIKAFGPNAQAAQFEGSKSFSRKFMKKYNLPTVEFKEFTCFDGVTEYIEEKGAPIVIKADGLAAGKGVCVAQTNEEAIEFARDCLDNSKFGESSAKIIIEECLFGEEGSYLVFIDSKTFKPMSYSQDHKPIFEGGKGANTGGMGAYSPAPILEGYEDELENEIINKFLQGTKEEGIEYKGVLYVGVIKTETGIKIIEFNCRFGDPETQVILPRMKSDLLEVMNAVADGTLEGINLEWYDNQCMSVVLSSAGYPGSYETGKEITGLESITDCQVIHAGTKEIDDKLVTSGGRVLNIVGTGSTLKEASDKVYADVEKINFEGSYFRRDIGKKELDRQ